MAEMSYTKSRTQRIAEFVQYHKNGDGECNGILLRAYADQERMTERQRFDLAYFYSLCYCIPSAIIMYDAREQIRSDPEQWAAEHKGEIIFQSDRRYVRCGDTFVKMLQQYSRKLDAKRFGEQTTRNGTVDFDLAFKTVSGWYFFGRFSCFLFVETYARLCGYKTTQGSITWAEGDTATSGLLNVYGLDGAADHFDKTGRLPPQLTQERMDKLLGHLRRAIRASGGETSIAEVETSLCAYRKFYKGTRYNGYYLDRQLEELRHYASVGEYGPMVDKLYSLRKRLFSAKYLGEVGGWTGIRKQCKTLYKRTGEIM